MSCPAAGSAHPDDPYVAPGALALGSGGEGAQVTIRGAPYGYYDTGTLLSLIATDRPIAQSRAGVNGGFEHGVAAMAQYPDLDMVALYDQVTSLPPRLTLTGVTYDRTHIFPHPALGPGQRAQLRRSMWVITNSIDPSMPAPRPPRMPPAPDCYASTVTGWSPDGRSITVSGWTVPGGGNAAPGQVPGPVLDTAQSAIPAAFFGAPTKVFANNWVLDYDPDRTAQDALQVRRFEGLELDMWNRARRDEEASFHGMTIGYTAFHAAPDGHPVRPGADSYAMLLAGELPRGLVIADTMDRLIDAGGFILQPSRSPAPAVGSTHVRLDVGEFIDSNRLRLLTYTRRDRDGGGWPAASVHLALHVDGDAGTTGGSPMAEVVFNPPGHGGGIALTGASGRGFAVNADGGADFSGGVRLASFRYADLPQAGRPGTELFCRDCRKPSEGPAHGTGMPVFDDGTHWISTAGTLAAR